MRTLSTALTTEMNSLTRTPASRVTVERWMPEWSAKISGLSGGKTEQYAHGHGVATAEIGPAVGTAGFFSALLFDLAAEPAATTETVICRARSGSYTSPQNGHLYISIIRDTDLETPANWDTLWTDTGITGLMYPAWTANSGASHGSSIAVVNSGNGFRVFYMLATGDLCYVDVSYTGTVSVATTIASLGTGAQLASMQIASCLSTEIFVLIPSLVEASLAAWHKDMYGTFIRRYSYSGAWTAGNTFHFHTHAEAGLLRDTPQEGSDFGDTSGAGITAQWGKRFCGGLAANNIDSNTALVTVGMTFWRRWGYDTHYHGLMSFIYHRDSGWWERGPEDDAGDFTEGARLHLTSFVRGCQVEGSNFLIWNRNDEPSDFQQTPGAINIPRIEEVVFAKLSTDGQYFTQFSYLGDQDNLTSASIVVVNHSGTKLLYAIGWRSVYEAQPASFLCSVTSPQDLDSYCDGWRLNRTNRKVMSLDLNLFDPAILFAAGTVVKARSLARVYYGIAGGESIQAGQGFIDTDNPSLSASSQGDFSEGATINCYADDLLMNTRAEIIEDVLPQNTMIIPPTSPVKHIQLSRGLWKVDTMTWPTMFFPGSFDALQDQPCWRLWSFPYANTGGAGGSGDPGKILTERPDYMGSWFKDITWLAMSPMVDGAIEASVRFGDVYNQPQFTFKANDGNQVYATIVRDNGIIQYIQWRTGGYSGPIVVTPTPKQFAVMAGLICHAPEVGRKYAFVWENNSNFSASSHTNDTWKQEDFDNADYSAHGTGSNRLYLIVSDYDGANWVNQSVAGGIAATGLTPGQPADLRMQVLGGTIYCYYRAHSTGTPNQWRFAFSYKAGRFGAGVFGLVGRGHAGIQWDVLYPGKTKIVKCENHVDFWNIKLSDAVIDRTLEEHLTRYSWRGFTATEFVATVKESSRVVNSGAFYNYGLAVENLCIDFKLAIPASGYEAGVFLRGVSAVSPQNECIRLGLVAHSTANSASNIVNYYTVKRRFYGGAEVTSAREYAPLPLQLSPNSPVPVRITARGPVYSIWIAGNFAGHFTDETSLGLYFGLYAIGGASTFYNVLVPELYEIPASALQEVNQAMGDAIQKVIGKRKVKAIFTYDGKLKFSYFSTHDTGPAFTHDNLWRSDLKRDSRYISKLRLQGSGSFAIFQSSALTQRGQRYQVIDNSDILLREFAYKEAQAIVSEMAESQQQETFVGLPDLRVDPEDQTEITISRQGIAGNFIVDDIGIDFEMGDNPSCQMTISTRQTVAL